MAQKEPMTNRQKVAEILMEIEKNSKYERDNGFTKRHEIYGKIGDDLRFYGDIFDGNAYPSNIHLMDVRDANNKKWIAEIALSNHKKHAFDESEYGKREVKPIDEDVEIQIRSAASEHEFLGIVTDDLEEKLKVIYAHGETPEMVIDGIQTAIAHSKDKAVIAKKLSKLNLPSHIKIKDLDAVAESLLQQIHAQNTNADNGREM